MSTINIKALTVPELLSLKDSIEKLLNVRKAELQSQLDQITGIAKTRSIEKTARRKVSPKYRDKAGNEWSGRGLQPRWLKEALKSGKKIETFMIAQPEPS